MRAGELGSFSTLLRFTALQTQLTAPGARWWHLVRDYELRLHVVTGALLDPATHSADTITADRESFCRPLQHLAMSERGSPLE
jgi:hypothetical protein